MYNIFALFSFFLNHNSLTFKTGHKMEKSLVPQFNHRLKDTVAQIAFEPLPGSMLIFSFLLTVNDCIHDSKFSLLPLLT